MSAERSQGVGVLRLPRNHAALFPQLHHELPQLPLVRHRHARHVALRTASGGAAGRACSHATLPLDRATPSGVAPLKVIENKSLQSCRRENPF